MTSPFPGMDPFLESPTHWPDFHSTFIQTLREVIADELPDSYFARVQEDVLLVEPDQPKFKIIPDVLVARDDRPSRKSGGTVATLEPTVMQNVIALDERVSHYLEIVRLPDSHVVTVVEVLSPSNKQSERLVYTSKRDRILRGDEVNLVEVDLLRAGRRVALTEPLPADHYFAFVSRADRRPDCEVFHWNIRQALPSIPVPLSPGTPDCSADLAKAFRMAYERGRYGRLIRYDAQPPPPAFDNATFEWIVETVARPT